MTSASRCLRSLDELRAYVQEVLCGYDDLLPNAFVITERLILRQGEPCGMYFCLHGPRAVKFSAVWETEKNRILFYGPDGERFHRTQLVAESALVKAAG